MVYDPLVSPALLEEAPASALKIFAGKASGGHCLPQSVINRLLIHHARCGRLVVRLKGGDPFVFGRGGEEALACIQTGVDVEAVPGVSSSVAVPAVAGIPVTHRGLSSSFAVVTGHRPPTLTIQRAPSSGKSSPPRPFMGPPKHITPFQSRGASSGMANTALE